MKRLVARYTYQAVAKALKLEDGTEIVSISSNPSRSIVEIVISHKMFDEVPEGQEAPEYRGRKYE